MELEPRTSVHHYHYENFQCRNIQIDLKLAVKKMNILKYLIATQVVLTYRERKFIEYLTWSDYWEFTVQLRVFCCIWDPQGSPLHHFNSCWRSGHKFVCCKPCYNFWCIMEPFTWCSEHLPGVQIWPEEAMLHIPLLSTGMYCYPNKHE
jgi:hypothetical protein